MISSQSTNLTPEILLKESHWSSPPRFFQILCIRKINFWFPYAEANHFHRKQYNSIMSSLRTFILNGIYLIIISQTLLSHDIYYHSEFAFIIALTIHPEGYILLNFIRIWSISCFYHCSSLKQISKSRLPFLVLQILFRNTLLPSATYSQSIYRMILRALQKI